MSKKILCYVLLPAFLAAGGWRVFKQYWAFALFTKVPGVEGARAAVDWDPEGPEYYHRLGVFYADLRGVEGLDMALRHLRKAAELNPYDWRAQLDLGIAAERAGALQDAERAYQQAAFLNPRSASYHWRVANFYLRRGRFEDSSREAEQVMKIDSRYRFAWILLLDRMGAPTRVIEQYWPQDNASRLQLLRALVQRRREADFESDRLNIRVQWDRILSSPEKVTLKEAAFYIDDLFLQGQTEQARTEWIRLAKRAGIDAPDFRDGNEAVWNGDFEQPFSGSRLDWQVGRAADFSYGLSPGEGVMGSQALRVEFPGSKNLDFSGIRQIVAVTPGAEYQLSVWIKARQISTDQGARLQITDPNTGVVLAETEAVTGTVDWTEFGAEARVPTDVRCLAVQVRRKPSRRIDNLLRGTLWVDSVRLRRLLRRPPG